MSIESRKKQASSQTVRRCPCYQCRSKVQNCRQDPNDKRWYCDSCWAAYSSSTTTPSPAVPTQKNIAVPFSKKPIHSQARRSVVVEEDDDDGDEYAEDDSRTVCVKTTLKKKKEEKESVLLKGLTNEWAIIYSFLLCSEQGRFRITCKVAKDAFNRAAYLEVPLGCMGSRKTNLLFDDDQQEWFPLKFERLREKLHPFKSGPMVKAVKLDLYHFLSRSTAERSQSSGSTNTLQKVKKFLQAVDPDRETEQKAWDQVTSAVMTPTNSDDDDSNPWTRKRGGGFVDLKGLLLRLQNKYGPVPTIDEEAPSKNEEEQSILQLDQSLCSPVPHVIRLQVRGNRTYSSSSRDALDELWIGDKFLAGWSDLQRVDFREGLEKLTKVGNGFLSSCPRLTHLDLRGLTHLKHIGDGCMMNLTSLKKFDGTTLASGLPSLVRMGDKWLAGTSALEKATFSNFPQLELVGENWLQRSGLQKEPVLEGFTSLKQIRLGAFSQCSRLESLTVTPEQFPCLQKVGPGFAAECAELQSVIFASTTPVGEKEGTSSLPHQGFENLADIRSGFLYKCESLEMLDLNGLTNPNVWESQQTDRGGRANTGGLIAPRPPHRRHSYDFAWLAGCHIARGRVLYDALEDGLRQRIDEYVFKRTF